MYITHVDRLFVVLIYSILSSNSAPKKILDIYALHKMKTWSSMICYTKFMVLYINWHHVYLGK
jgi:hypothetical protein